MYYLYFSKWENNSMYSGKYERKEEFNCLSAAHATLMHELKAAIVFEDNVIEYYIQHME